MPPLTVFFHELEFSQTRALGFSRPDLPIGPIMDFLLEFIERAIKIPHTLVVGSTTNPVTLRHAFLAPGRFERIVEVAPRFPEDIVAALQIHCRAAEKRAGRSLFDAIDWAEVVRHLQEPRSVTGSGSCTAFCVGRPAASRQARRSAWSGPGTCSTRSTASRGRRAGSPGPTAPEATSEGTRFPPSRPGNVPDPGCPAALRGDSSLRGVEADRI
jgi:hypothetical protein